MLKSYFGPPSSRNEPPNLNVASKNKKWAVIRWFGTQIGKNIVNPNLFHPWNWCEPEREQHTSEPFNVLEQITFISCRRPCFRFGEQTHRRTVFSLMSDPCLSSTSPYKSGAVFWGWTTNIELLIYIIFKYSKLLVTPIESHRCLENWLGRIQNIHINMQICTAKTQACTNTIEVTYTDARIH